ncbi:MAG: hypothetical protein KGR48_12375 [Alphaproteobacteria bacterium]|nr:hypothetical protein [Alphaproteobacteria bacterium]MDE2073376.1 DUF4102 domain-containing protein [Alphaproteobacteria bacterium]
MPLTDRQCRLTPTDRLQKLSDGDGLQLWIQPKPVASLLRRLAYRFGGKQKLLALGAYRPLPNGRIVQFIDTFRRRG